MSLDNVPLKVEVKWEAEDVEDTATALYAQHEVKQELVLGPELLQTPDVSSVLQETVEFERYNTEMEFRRWGLKYCFVKLERLPLSTEGDFQMQFFVCEFCDSFLKFRDRLRTHERQHVRQLLLDTDEVVASSFGYINLEHSNEKEEQKCHTSEALITQPLQKTDSSNNEAVDEEPLIDKISDDNSLELPIEQHEDMSVSSYRACNKVGSHFCASCCKEIQSTLWEFERHLLNHIKKNPELKEVFKKKIKLFMHKEHVCNVCQRQFKRRYLLQRHRKVHTRSALSCNICKKIFTGKFNLSKHIEKPCTAKPKMYSCVFCDKSYTRMSDYYRHINSHAGPFSQRCNICDSFVCNDKLKEHIDYHMSKDKGYEVKLTDSSESNCNAPSQELTSSAQSVNFRESTLFSRLQLLNQTLSSNRVGNSKP